MEIEQGGGRGDFAARLDDRFAFLQRRESRQLLGALADQGGSAVENGGPLLRRDFTPLLEPARGGLQRAFHVGGGRQRQLAQ
ncbi:hypothetical protein GCM10020258_45700 [Sphingomonas yabuuchiae]